MITPPQLAFYLSLLIILIGSLKTLFFHKNTTEDDVIFTLSAGIFAVIYVITYVVITYIP